MNKPNPLVPQGTNPDKGKQHIRITVFAILAVHVVLLGVLLIAGCNKKEVDPLAVGGELPPAPAPLPTASTEWPAPPPITPTQAIVSIPGAGAPTTGGNVPSNTTPIYTPPIHETPVSLDPPVPSFTEHTIVSGESFATIGKRYKVGYKSIADANPGVDSTRLKIGQKIKIPPPKAAGNGVGLSAGTPAPASMDSGEKTYTVKSQDNLTKIAKAHGTTIKALRAANNLRTDGLKVGQKLKIPGKTPPPFEATTPPPAAPPAVPDLGVPAFVPVPAPTNR